MIIVPIIAVASMAVVIFFNMPSFGKSPSKHEISQMELSLNYKNGKFQNQLPTETMNKEKGYIKGIVEIVSAADKRSVPETDIPSKKIDLKNIPSNENIVVWMGHSSLFIQFSGKKILVDPVFSLYASPVSFLNKSFKGMDIYSAEDIPEIDILMITHDHWDHLDYPTVLALKPKVKYVICPLGVGSHFRYWKYDSSKIIETDWNESIKMDALKIHTLPARHFSGRSIIQNKTLWASFLLESDDYKIYLSGDTGYGPHFLEIGKKFGNIDLAIMESGQYNADGWPDIHILPSEAITAVRELNTKLLLPIHNGKFKLSLHAWDEPYDKLYELTKNTDIQLLTPLPGEKINLDEKIIFPKWW